MKNISSTLKTMRSQYRIYVMLLPMVILVTIFSYLPLAGWVMAFTDYNIGMSMFSGKFVGLKEFINFFSGANDAGYVIVNTLGINLISLFVELVSACAFAILLTEVKLKSFKRTVQSISFFPFFISWVIAYSIFNTFLAIDSGLINIIMVKLGLIKSGINFMGAPEYSWGVMVFINFWKYLGYNSVIFISAIAGIDQEQYEAAVIDGASRIDKIRYITLPALIPTFVVLLIMNSGWIFNSNFDQFFLFRNEGNWKRMEVLDVYIYRYGLKLLDFSYATAVGIIKTFASLIMFYTVNKIAKKISGKSML